MPSLRPATSQNAGEPKRAAPASSPCPGISRVPCIKGASGQARTSAFAKGWRDARAMPAAVRSICGSWPSGISTGRPSVSVPVLSSTAQSAVAKRSSAVGEATSTPRLNSAPFATTCTAGTAIAKPQGQVISSTQTAFTKASCHSAPKPSHHSRKVATAMAWAIGT